MLATSYSGDKLDRGARHDVELELRLAGNTNVWLNPEPLLRRSAHFLNELECTRVRVKINLWLWLCGGCVKLIFGFDTLGQTRGGYLFFCYWQGIFIGVGRDPVKQKGNFVP